ncbi:MAG: hypothetical protein ACK4X1_01285 [Terricaulis sp.]
MKKATSSMICVLRLSSFLKPAGAAQILFSPHRWSFDFGYVECALMGSFSSGRCATHETVEGALRLDLAQPAVRKVLERQVSSDGVWTWSCGGSNIANVGYRWAHSRLFLRYACNGQPITQTITLERTTPNFGGHRWWFICPVNGQRVRALYLPSGATRWASRVAHDLRYESQRASGPFTRLVRELRRDGAREARNEVRRIARSQRRRDFAAPLR